MSVYTVISDDEFSEILKHYSLGDFLHAQGIQSGIENTNYFLTTTKGEYVFTLFEKISRQQAEFYISLLKNLSSAGIRCPQPQPDKHAQTLKSFNDKPFTLVTRLNGVNVTTTNENQCQAIAIELAKIHSTPLMNLSPTDQLVQNRRGKEWRDNLAKTLIPKLNSHDAKLLATQIEQFQSFDDSQLPKGIIHSDLFKDNALFEGDQLTGIIDFYDACYDAYIYDLAITVNAWCCTKAGKLNHSLVSAFLQAYQSIRPLTDTEKEAWPTMLKMAATRFWLSRLEDSLVPVTELAGQNTLTHRKDPAEFQQILENHIRSVSRALA